MQNQNAHNELKKRTAWISVLSNTLLVVLKLVVGIFSGSISIISEAAHSAVDLLAALIAFFAVRKASEPPDKQHAYGHGKFENLSAAAEAFLIVLVAVWIVFEAVGKFQSSEPPEYLGYGILIMLISVIVNYLVSRRLLSVAHQTGSDALEADALHLRTDVWTSLGVLTGLAAIQITGLTWLDPAIAVVVSVIIFKAGYEMTLKNLWELTDISLPPEEEALIQEIITSHPEVISFHKLRTRRSGSYRQIDMHIVLENDMHLDKAHDICDEIEAQIKAALGLCVVVIHLEPDENEVE